MQSERKSSKASLLCVATAVSVVAGRCYYKHYEGSI